MDAETAVEVLKTRVATLQECASQVRSADDIDVVVSGWEREIEETKELIEDMRPPGPDPGVNGNSG
jgi:hypothetical protein